MDFKCSYNQCDSLSMMYCICEKDGLFLCTMHIKYHIDENPEISHPIKTLYKKIAEDCKNEYLESLNSQLNLVESTLNLSKSPLQTAMDNLKNLDSSIENYLKNQISAVQK